MDELIAALHTLYSIKTTLELLLYITTLDEVIPIAPYRPPINSEWGE